MRYRFQRILGGHFVNPTIFTDVDDSTRVFNEEIFGPVEKPIACRWNVVGKLD